MQAVRKTDLSLASESSSKSLKKSYKSIVAAILIAATFLLVPGKAWAVSIEAEGLNLPATVHGGEALRFTWHIRTPYPYDIDVDGKSYLLQMLWGWRKQQYLFFPLTQGFTIPAMGTCDVECSFTVPRNLQEQPYAVGFAVRGADMYTWFNGKSLQTHFEAE